MVKKRKFPLEKRTLIRFLFILICSSVIASLFVFLYTVNSQNVSQFWTELISYGLSVLTPILTFLLADIRVKDKADIDVADKVEKIFSKLEALEQRSSTKPGESYKPKIPLSSDKLRFLLDAGVINRRQYKYLLDKHSEQ